MAGTPNTQIAGAVSYEVNSGWVTHGIDESAQNRYFVFKERAPRSYCIEAVLGGATYFPLDPNLTLFADSTGATVLATNTDGSGEPPQNKGSRICYISTLAAGTSAIRMIKINVPVTAGSGDSGFVRLRVVDTTLWSTNVTADCAAVKPLTVTVTNSSSGSHTVAFYIGNSAIGSSTNALSNGIASVSYCNLPVAPFASGPIFVAHTAAPGVLAGTVNSAGTILDLMSR